MRRPSDLGFSFQFYDSTIKSENSAAVTKTAMMGFNSTIVRLKESINLIFY